MNALTPKNLRILRPGWVGALLLWGALETVACARVGSPLGIEIETAKGATQQIAADKPALPRDDLESDEAHKGPRLSPAPEIAPPYAAAFLEAELALNDGNNARAQARLEPLIDKSDCPLEVFKALAELHMNASEADKTLTVVAAGLKHFPGDPDLLMLKGRAFQDHGKLADAIAAMEEALKTQPHRQEALEALSELHLQQLRQVTNEDDLDRQMGSLIDIYVRMLAGREGSDRLPPLLILSSLNLRRNQPTKAEPYAHEAVELDEKDPRAQMALANVFEAESKTSEALHTYMQALILQPGNKDVYDKIDTLLGNAKGGTQRTDYYLAQAREFPGIKELQEKAAGLLMGASRWAEAEEILTGMTQNWPDDVKSRLSLVHAWLEQGKFDKAIAVAQKMSARKDDFAPLVTVTIGAALAEKGQTQKGYDMVDALYQHNKDDETLALGAATLLKQLNKTGLAIATIKEYRQRHADSIKAVELETDLLSDAEKYSEAYAVIDSLTSKTKDQNKEDLDEIRSELAQHQKKWNEALGILTGLVQQHSDNPDYQMSLGYVNQQLGRNADAEAHYREALRLNPDDPEACNTLGYFLAETKQKLDEAMTLIIKAHQLAPGAGHIVDSLGWVYYQQGDFKHALEQLQAAAKLMQPTPEAAEVYEHLGDAYDKLGRHLDARKAWQKAVDLNKDQATAREKLDHK